MYARCSFALLLLTTAPHVWAEHERPNLVFLLADDQRYDAIGAHGNPIIETPQLDRLVRNGVSFRRAFVTTSICMTSRASIMTGQYASTHGVNTFGRDLTAEQLRRTYFTQLREAGYRVGFVGKWGVGNPPEGVFDYNRGYPGQGSYYGDASGKHLTEVLADQAVQFLQDTSDERPFCLSVSFKAPHVDEGPGPPFRYDRRFDDRYADVEIPPPPLSDRAFFEAQPKFLQESENRLRWQRRFSTPELYQQSVKGYYRLVNGIDMAVGRVRRALENAGVADNTVIVYASDHGFYLGDRGFAGKWYAHDVSIRIPLVIYDPRGNAADGGRVIDAFALNIDVAPTLLDYAGITPPETMQGASLRPLLADDDIPDWRDEFYYEHTFEYGTIPKSEGVRNNRYKYIVYYEQQPPYEELYDLRADPDEAVNLAGDESMSAVLAEMRERVEALRAEAASAGETGLQRTARSAGSTAGR